MYIYIYIYNGGRLKPVDKFTYLGRSVSSTENEINTRLYVYVYKPNRAIGLMSRVFASGPGQILPKTQKIVLDDALLNSQRFKVRIKGKVEQSWERSSALPYTSMW